MPRFTGLDPFTMSAYQQLGPEAQRDILATQGQEIDPLPYLAGQISGANIAGGAPGPRFGSVAESSNLRGLARRLLNLFRGRGKANVATQPTYRGFQEGFGVKPGYPLYDLQQDITDAAGNVLHPKGSTVSKKTLQKYGIDVGEGPTRPWPGIYQRTLQEGRTQPLSYRSPTTTELPLEASELRELLESLGGSYFGIKR